MTPEDLGPGWAVRAPLSPMILMQEAELRRGEPPLSMWRMLLACVLLNKTTCVQARPALDALISEFKTPHGVCAADPAAMIEIVRPCGLGTRRTTIIRRLSVVACVDGWQRFVGVLPIPGVGQYALDSWKIFVLGRTDVAPTDKELKKYMEWRNAVP